MDDVNFLSKYFLIGVSSVQPDILLTKIFSRKDENLIVGDRIYPLKKTYVIGFGKAVGGMVPIVEKVLNSSGENVLQEGIISVPVGYLKCSVFNTGSKIRFYEGAKNNLPDDNSYATAEKIMNVIKKLNEDDLLFVLISGGGSALFPIPLSPLTLTEKTEIIKSLSLRGASIYEINTVRKVLSAVKGGKLIKKIKCQVVTFMLSDIIESGSLDIIASGPTIPNLDSVDAPYEILSKYNIEITPNLKSVLEARRLEAECPDNFDRVYNIVIGNNNIALKSIVERITIDERQYIPIIMTSSLQGEASVMGKEMARFAFAILRHLGKQNVELNIKSYCERLKVSESGFNSLANAVQNYQKPIVLLFGGETTVTVKGTGTGGRNQEMVLACSIELERMSKLDRTDGEITFLSGGTDGIDGPTDAAGAMTYCSIENGNVRLQTHGARQQNMNPEAFLQDNNSYEYFKQLAGGKYLLKPGHTGTNVMDIQLLLIRKID